MRYTRFCLAILLFLVFCCTSLLQAQVPQAFHYQMVVRDGGDQLVRSRSIGLRLTIQRANAGSPVILYQETQTLATDLNGLLQVEVGRGTRNPSYGLFADIPWGDYTDIELKAEADPAGGTAYSLSATQPLQAVPYAFLSAESQGLGNAASLGNHAGGLQLKSVKDPTEAQDVVTKHYFDSVIAELVRLNNAYTRDTAACVTPESLPFAWRGHSLSGSGIYRHTLAHAAAGGLDSIIILTLTVASGTHNVETVVACDSYEWHAVSRTATGNYTYPYTNAGGCPSVDTLKLTINATTSYTDSRTACDSLWWHDVKYTTPQTDGTVTHTTTGANGCDSTVTLHLTAVFTTAHTAYTVATRGAYTWASAGSDGHGDGSIYDVSGSYTGPEYADANGCPAHDTLHLTVTPVNIDNVLNGRFTINAEGDKVLFSRGNLQYLKSGTDGYANQTFRFALHQYDFVGGTSTSEPAGTFGNVYLSNSTQCGNQNISSTYQGWIDLFGWGTSGWNSGAGIYQPWFSSTTSADYTPGGVASNNLTGDYANADWGVYNPIVNGGNTAGQFRVLSSDEWSYLYNTRTDAASKRSQGRIDMGGGDYVFGVILLPDEWTLPTGCSFDANFATNGYATNTYSLAQWALMEANGAVFLPQAGQRNGTDFQMVNVYRSRYWSSTNNGAGNAFVFQFHSGSINPAQSIGRAMGNSVRLVFDDADCTAGSSSDSHTECDSYTWPVNGVTYTASGTYTARLINSHGCDSTITLTLTINPAKAFTDSRTACDSLRWHGVKYTTPQTDGTVTYATTAANGCDSTVTLHLTAVYTTAHQSYDVEETLPFTWAASGTYGHGTGTAYAAEGTYVGPEYADANSCPAHDTLHLTISSNNGCTLGGTFTVNASGDRVQFTCGNLQYRASTNEWRLAPEQWHFVGSGSYYAFDDDDTEYKCNSAKSDNNYISSSYCGWIDLFGFGTSGWNSGYTAYQPYSTSSTAGDYINRSLTGDYANADWGVYNVISGTPAGTYRTMTSDEWQYILSGRENAAQKYGMGTLFGIWGVFLIPDNWTQPAGVSFTAGTASAYSTNTFTTDEQWEALQNSGVVFLPFTGYRYTPASWTDPGSSHYVKYHTSTVAANTAQHNTFYAYYYNSAVSLGVGTDTWYNGNQYGFAVRLVKDFEPCEVVAPVQNETACGSYTWPSTGVTYTGSTTVSGVKGIHQSPEGCDSIVSLNLTITPSSVYLSNAVQNITEGSAMSPAVITATNFTVAVSGLPAGVTYNDATYTISGTPTGGQGTYDYTVTATSTNGCPAQVLNGSITVGDGVSVPAGALSGAFNVAADKQVLFSKGNLQYQASTGTFQFAEQQYTALGTSAGNTATGATRSTNANWTDLFVWGTSGWQYNASHTVYQPWDNTYDYDNALGYLVGQATGATAELRGDYANGDWGVYNPISNGGNAPGLWYTLTDAEWSYLFEHHKYYSATVNGVKGLVILPASWTTPTGCSVPAAASYLTNFTSYTYTTDQWALMEDAGAVFLPMTGYKDNYGSPSNVTNSTTYAYYWTATSNGIGMYSQWAKIVYFYQNSTKCTFTASSSHYSVNSCAVRLACDYATCSVLGPTTVIDACDSYTWSETGITYTESGDYTRLGLTSAAGCDSIVTLHLTIGHSNSQAYYATAVGSYTWTADGDMGRGSGSTYAASGTYTGPESVVDGCASADTLHLGIKPIQGSMPGKFSVAAGKQVSFSQGNLQYLAKAADGYSDNSWRFAENQWNWVGDGSTYGNVYMADGTTPCDNTSISENDHVWIDMFGYACSGWDNGKTCYQPYHTTNIATYYLGQTLTGTYAGGDWAFYNRIYNGGYNDSLWRTLSSAEMTFLLGTTSPRTANHRSFGTVNGVAGLIILPDSWTLPNGCSYTGNVTANFTTNTYTLDEWARMETAGAIFLPQSYRRVQNTAVNTGDGTYYWTSTSVSTSNSYLLKFLANTLNTASSTSKFYGGAVRPVYDLPNSCEIKYTTVEHESCDKFELDGETYYSDVEVVKRLVADDGCDSLVTHRIVIKQSGSKNYYQSALDTYTWPTSGDNGHGTGATYTESNPLIVGPRYDGDNACDAYDTLHLTITPIQGAIAHPFSVAADQQVYFSNGNLQYQGSTGTFRFAEHQYTVIGDAVGNTTAAASRATNTNWIDLFGYGTSGWNSGATYYRPYDNNSTSTSYLAQNLSGDFANADWGVYNAILGGGNVPQLWRTLSQSELNYLLNTRTNAAQKKATASVAGVPGLVLLPDDWSLPVGCTFTAANYSTSSPVNIYTAAQWSDMEANGAVFLPLGGYRSNTSVTTGYLSYWTSTHYNASNSYRLYLSNGSAPTVPYNYKHYGYNVRLVVNAPTTCATRMTSAMGSETITNCGPFAYHGTTYYADTATTMRFTNASGCDTLVRLTLTIKSTGDKYKVNPSEDTYTWAADGDKGHGTGLTYGEEDAGIILGPTYTADGCTCRDTLKLSFTPPGRLSGLFSVSATKQVYFSQGNLQYTTTGEHAVATGGTQSGTFRFAEHQYDFVGGTTSATPTGTFGNVYVAAVQSGNQNVSSSYTGWIDLFGWGTSGWNSGATGYTPYYTTLSSEEWTYLRSTRSNAANLFGFATVNGVKGLVILPDDWVLPTGCSFTEWSSSQFYTGNTYTTEKWALMEAAGAVFLPAGGYRGTGSASATSWFYGSQYYGRYWSSSVNSTNAVQAPYFYGNSGTTSVTTSNSSRGQGCSVRLVMEKE